MIYRSSRPLEIVWHEKLNVLEYTLILHTGIYCGKILSAYRLLFISHIVSNNKEVHIYGMQYQLFGRVFTAYIIIQCLHKLRSVSQGMFIIIWVCISDHRKQLWNKCETDRWIDMRFLLI